MGAREPASSLFQDLSASSQVTQSRTGAEFPSGTSVFWMLGPGFPCTAGRKLWVWVPALLGASKGAFLTGPHGSLRQGQAELGLGGCRWEEMVKVPRSA